ncbi:zinc ribbon domain-containing protein [Chromatium okenii]|uniref:zinc ribbon domain-containing protein n=1 Tax=Chromatium okenii TaxID=61644 RepID=UPI0026EA629F|nr:hypothetical protein [Chromatium okenii]MBV5310653.1 hypothetical protein [Chromatium okenii]
METSYKISATGIAPEIQEEAVREGLQKLMRGDSATFEKTFQRIVQGQSVVLVKGLAETRAQELLARLIAVGLTCQLEPMTATLSLVAKTYRCPACGHEQEHNSDGKPDTCEQCGVVADAYVAPPPRPNQELRDAIERERQALAAQFKVADDKETREAERKRTEKLRKIARRKVEAELGIDFYSKMRPFLAPKVSIPVVTLLLIAGGTTGWMLWNQQSASPEIAAANGTAANAQPGSAAGSAGAAGAGGGGKTQITITPPPGLSVNIGAPGGATGAAMSLDAMGGTGGGAALPDEFGNLPASAGAQTSTLAVTIPTASAMRGNTEANDPAINDDPRVLTGLAFYRFDNGDLNTAAKLLDRVTLRLNDKTAAPTSLPNDQLLRDAVALRAALAVQYAQRNEIDSAQTQWKRANRIADSISATNDQAMAYASLGRAAHDNAALVAQKDYFKLATAAANRTTSSPLAQVELLGGVAQELTRAAQNEAGLNLFNKATAAVNRIQDNKTQSAARAVLAQQFAETGEIQKAVALLAATPDPAPSARRVTALTVIAHSRAKQGDSVLAQRDFNAAIAQAGALADATERTETFVFIARHLLQAGNPAAAAQIIAAVGQ